MYVMEKVHISYPFDDVWLDCYGGTLLFGCKACFQLFMPSSWLGIEMRIQWLYMYLFIYFYFFSPRGCKTDCIYCELIWLSTFVCVLPCCSRMWLYRHVWKWVWWLRKKEGHMRGIIMIQRYMYVGKYHYGCICSWEAIVSVCTFACAYVHTCMCVCRGGWWRGV